VHNQKNKLLGGSNMNLTTKDLTVLSDLMEYEQTLFKQCKQLSENFSDSSFSDLTDTIASQHKENFNRLFSQLN
jgi:trans-2-enoyl-CoA reductase